MKRVIILVFICLIGFQNYAQNGALYQEWFLISYELEGESYGVSEISPSISPGLIIDQDLGFTGNAACNNYNGIFSYDDVNDFLILDGFDASLTICDFQTHNDFETDYFSLFVLNQSYSYSIIYDGDGLEYLDLELAPGNILHYSNTTILSIDKPSVKTISIYPNPVSEKLFISSNNTIIETIIIYNVLGETIKSIQPISSNQLDVSTLSNGMYFIEIYSSEGKTIKKFIKK